MSEASERVRLSKSVSGRMCDFGDSYGTEYIRADLPATNAQVLAHPLVKELVEALGPFSAMAGEMFARNWNDDGVAISLVVKGGTMRLTFKEFNKAHAALAKIKEAGE